MEARDNTPLVGGLLIVVAILAILGLGALSLVGRGTGESVETDTSADSPQSQPAPATRESEPPSTTGVLSGRIKVEIEDATYMPASITVKRGTIVVWENRDTDQHDVAPDENKQGAPRSQLLSRGESYSHTFDTLGTFTYHCSPHPYMKGTVTVVD